MNKRVFALICAFVLVISVLGACGTEPAPKETVDQGEAENTAPKVTNPPEQESTAAPEESTSADEVDLTGVKVSDDLKLVCTTDRPMYSVGAKGFSYRDSDTRLYGIVSVDGTYDSGAIYYDVKELTDYFSVTIAEPTDPDNLDMINNTGVVDGYGNVIIPAEYAIIKNCENKRFFQVIKVTERTNNKEEALVYLTSSWFSLSAKDDDILYKGVWYIFDTETGKVIDGVSATNGYSAGVTGDKVFYNDDDRNHINTNTKGQPYPKDAQVFDDGSYYNAADGNVYDAFGSKLFSYDKDKYGSLSMSKGYYRCSKYESGKNIYVCLDKSGKEITPVYEKAIYVYGENIMLVDDKAYDFAGNQLVAGDVTDIREYDLFWYLSNYETGDFYVLNRDMQLLYAGNKNNGEEFEGYYDCLKKTENDKKLYYSFAEEDFVYEGNAVGYGYVEVKRGDDTRDLINTVTGETVMSGFRQYSIDEDQEGTLYFFGSCWADKWVWAVYEMK